MIEADKEATSDMTDKNKNHSSAEMPTRRRILKQAAGTLPLIATIPSGAALAVSSNMVRTVSKAEAVTKDGTVLCLSTTDPAYQTTYKTYDSAVDLGVAPYPPHVTEITVRDYYRTVPQQQQQQLEQEQQGNGGRRGRPKPIEPTSTTTSTAIDAFTACEEGGTVYYQNGTEWVSGNVPKGAFTSVSALASFYPYTKTDI